MDTLINKTLSELAKELYKFREGRYRPEQLRIYMPLYFKNAMVNEIREMFIAKAEPLKFMGVDIMEGYEDFIIIANSGVILEPRKLKSVRVRISKK